MRPLQLGHGLPRDPRCGVAVLVAVANVGCAPKYFQRGDVVALS
jgi:hypothetical protein